MAYQYDTTLMGGYSNPSTTQYHNIGQLQTPYFGKPGTYAGDYGPGYRYTSPSSGVGVYNPDMTPIPDYRQPTDQRFDRRNPLVGTVTFQGEVTPISTVFRNNTFETQYGTDHRRKSYFIPSSAFTPNS